MRKAKGGNIALARAAIELASTKESPREYIGRVIQANGSALTAPNQPDGVPAIGTPEWNAEQCRMGLIQ